jgi:hypothetical protein
MTTYSFLYQGLYARNVRWSSTACYSKSYLREKALVDGEVEVIHHDADRADAGFHLNTVKLNTTQLDKVRDLLSKC